MDRSTAQNLGNRVVFPINRIRKRNPHRKYEGTILDFSTGKELVKDSLDKSAPTKEKLVILGEEIDYGNGQLYEIVAGRELYQGKIAYNSARHIMVSSANKYLSRRGVYELFGRVNHNFIVIKNITGIRKIDSLSNPSSLLLKKH